MKLKKGLEVKYLGYKYKVIEISKLYIGLKRVNDIQIANTVQIAIGSNRFKQVFYDVDVDTYEEVNQALVATKVKITHKATKAVEYQDTLEGVLNQINDKEVFNSKSEATVWLYDALINGEGLAKNLLAPLYAIVSFYTYKHEIVNVSVKAVEQGLQRDDKKEKTTNFIELVDSVLINKSDFTNIALKIPIQYEKVILEALLGKINLGLVITDCKVILNKYKKRIGENRMKRMSDDALLELNGVVQEEMEDRGLEADGDVGGKDEEEAGIAEAIEESGLDNEEVIGLAKEAGIKVTATAKLKKADVEDLAETIETKIDGDSDLLNDFLDALLDAGAEEADDDDDDDADDADDADDEISLAELLEDALEDNSIVDILEEAEVECKLTAKQKKFDAEELSEVLEDKLDEDSMEALLEYLEDLVGDEADDDTDDDDDDDADDDEDYTVEDINDMDEDEIVELCEELEIKVPSKVTKTGLKKLRKAIIEELEIA